MPSNWETFPVEFRGGLISNMSPLQQGINAVGSATFLQNFEPSKEGGYKKVLGYEKRTADPVPGVGTVLGVKVINLSETVAVRSNGSVSVYHLDTGSGWSTIATAAGLGGKVSGKDFNFSNTHKVIFVDGLNYPAIFNDTTNTMSFLSSPADIEGSQHVEIYKNIVFLSKGPNLIYSAPYDETDYTPANGGGVINVGHTITGLTVFRDQLIVFARNKILRLVGSSVADFQLLPITDAIGCIDGATIQEVGGDILFLAPDGLRFLGATDRFGDFALSVASSPIESDVLKFVRNSQKFSSVVIRGKAQYRIFGYIESENRRTAKGLIATKFIDQSGEGMQWSETKGIKAYCADSRYVEGAEVILVGADDGYIYRLEVGSSFDGEDIEAIYESPFMPINDPSIRKTLYKMTLYADLKGTFSASVDFNFDLYKVSNYNTSQPPTINLSSNSAGVFIYGASNTLYGTAIYGSNIDKVYNSPVIGSGKTFSFRIEDNSTNPTFSLDTIVFEYASNDRT